MNIRRILSFFSFLLLSLGVACSTTINRRTEMASAEQFDSLRAVYYHLSDSLTWAFQTMMQDDDNKIIHMKQLLDEIQKSGNYQEDTLHSLYRSMAELQAKRYDSISLADFKTVRTYDSMAYAISEAVIELAEEHPDFSHNPVMMVLVDQIVDANNSILLYRLHYDRLSQEFNHFLEEYRSMIATMDSSGIPVQKRPTFGQINDSQEEEKE